MLHPVCRQISRLNFSGNLLPLSWLHHIRNTHGRVDLGAVVILSEVVFWYRWRELRDEKTGRITGVEQRFAGARFQRSLRHWAAFTGLTIKQVRRSLATLSRLGVVKVAFTRGRTVDRLACASYEPVPARLEAITYPYALEGTTCALWDTTCAPGGIAPVHTTAQKSLVELRRARRGQSSLPLFPETERRDTGRDTGADSGPFKRIESLAAKIAGGV